MKNIKYLLESVIGAVITSPILDESLRAVLNYDSSLWIFKFIFIFLFAIIYLVGIVVILDGLSRFFLNLSLKKALNKLKD